MNEFLIALLFTAAIFVVHWFRRQIDQDRALQPLRQAHALEVLHDRRGAPISSYELRKAVEECVPGMIGFGTWARLMDELVERGSVRKVWRNRGPNEPRWFGYQLAWDSEQT